MLTLFSDDWPKTIALPQGASLRMRRPTAEMRIDLALEAGRAIADVPIPDDPAAPERPVLLQKRLFRYTRSVAVQAIEDWAGIGDSAGQPLPCTPDAVARLVDEVQGVWQAIYRGYVEPYLLEVVAEKNASTPSASTTGPGA